jgi:hypothetical protein
MSSCKLDDFYMTVLAVESCTTTLRLPSLPPGQIVTNEVDKKWRTKLESIAVLFLFHLARVSSMECSCQKVALKQQDRTNTSHATTLLLHGISQLPSVLRFQLLVHWLPPVSVTSECPT